MSEVSIMTEEETGRLAELEAVIDKDLKGFLRVGMALKEIKEKKLYRGKYTTWKDYLKEEWDISRAYGDRYIEAFDVVENIKAASDKSAPMGELLEPGILPKNERQARPLTLLAPEQQPAAWEEAVLSSSGNVTALAVAKVVEKILEAQLADEKHGIQKAAAKEITVPDEFSEQFNRLLEVLDMYRKANWKGFNRKKALEFLKAIEEYIIS